MNTQELKNILLSEHKRDVKLMLIGYGIIVIAALLVIGLISWVIAQTGGSISGVISGAAEEMTSNVPTYVRFALPAGILISVAYLAWSYIKLANRPKEIEQFIQYIDNGKRVISILEGKHYRIKVPLYFVNYHTGAVQTFGIVLEGVSKPYILPVPFGYTSEVKDLLNENS